MMSLSVIRDFVSSLFIMLNQKTYILFRIEFLVVLVTLLTFLMFLMDFFRHIIHNIYMRAIFSVFDAVSDSIVLYLLGAMQTAPFKNQLFPVWALVLVNFRYSADYISGYGVPDSGGRRFIEWRNVLKLLGTAFLNWSRGSRFAWPLWSLWALQILRSGYRFCSHSLASHSIWHGRSSELVSEYMRVNYDTNHKKSEDCDPEMMKGYKYLVYGESKLGVKLRKPQYAPCFDITTQRARRRSAPREERSPLITLNKIWKYLTCLPHLDNNQGKVGKDLNKNQGKDGKDLNNNQGKDGKDLFAPREERSPLITLDKIWKCLTRPPHFDDNQGKDGKDLSLAFALSRLLRCKLEDVTLQGNIFDINRKLVEKIIHNNVGTSDAIRIMELQLGLTNDYFNTRYPMVFWRGFKSLSFNIVPSLVTFGVVCWLGVDIRRVYKPPNGELANLVQGINVIITWAFIGLMMVKEIWEIVTYLFSDWMRLLLVCKYVQRKDKDISDGCMDHKILQFFRPRITAKRWHGHIDQYVFVQSYDYRPRCWNCIHNLTTGMVPKKDDGAKLSSAIDVPDCVRTAILDKLRVILKEAQGDHLHKVIKTLSDVNGNRGEQLQHYFDLPTCSHIILVWHIATSLCEIKLAKEHGVNLSNPGYLCSLLSCFTSCCSSKSYLVDEKKKLVGELQKTYVIANSLSRYCAYLLVSKPDLIPDSFLVPKMVFQETVAHSYHDILKDCNSLQGRYDKLMEEAEKAAQDADNINKNGDVLQLGAMLAKELIDNESEEGRWVILAGVWAELLIHMAPTWNTEAHKKCLSRGEFITHIWALLWHCGIQESKLWRQEVEPENNAPAAPQDNNVGNDNDQAVDKTRQAGADMRNEQTAIKVHEADEVGGTKEHEAGNLRRGPRTIEGTGSSEIEETSQDATVEATNVQRAMAGQA